MSLILITYYYFLTNLFVAAIIGSFSLVGTIVGRVFLKK